MMVTMTTRMKRPCTRTRPLRAPTLILKRPTNYSDDGELDVLLSKMAVMAGNLYDPDVAKAILQP